MAEDKKESNLTPEERMIVAILFFLLASFFLVELQRRLALWQFSSADGALGMILDFIRNYLWPLIKLSLGVLGVVSVFGIAYSLNKLTAINKIENAIFKPTPAMIAAASHEGESSTTKSVRWEKVIDLVNSDNQSDWRLAIIEAEVILEEGLKDRGYPGNSVGDMLKAVAPGDIVNIDAAWEAHKVRNRIAHSGSNFDLNGREAQRTIALYEAVLSEMKLI